MFGRVVFSILVPAAAGYKGGLLIYSGNTRLGILIFLSGVIISVLGNVLLDSEE